MILYVRIETQLQRIFQYLSCFDIDRVFNNKMQQRLLDLIVIEFEVLHQTWKSQKLAVIILMCQIPLKDIPQLRYILILDVIAVLSHQLDLQLLNPMQHLILPLRFWSKLDLIEAQNMLGLPVSKCLQPKVVRDFVVMLGIFGDI